MTNDDVVLAVGEWVGAAIPEIGDRSYDYEPGEKPKGLPDVVVALTSEGAVAQAPAEFPIFGLQQVSVWVWRLGLSIMVENGVTDDDARAAALKHRSYARLLSAALFDDPRLGERLVDGALASPYSLGFDYSRPLVEYEDGTLGREMTIILAVGEPFASVD